MKNLYNKLALDGIRKNEDLYIPYCLLIILLVFIFSSMVNISGSSNLDTSYGINHVRTLLNMGLFIMTIFINIFLIYVDNYILKRRKKELGLYNVLGLNKNQLSIIITVEFIIIWIISISFGIQLSLLLYNIVEGLFFKSIGSTEKLSYIPNLKSILINILAFFVIGFVILVIRLIKIKKLSSIDMINTDEIRIKNTWIHKILGFVGFIFIILGYYLANSIKNPLESIPMFFISVFVVIIGTFLAFGAIVEFILKILKNKKSFYYKTKNFTAIGGLRSRVRENSGGLASIAIMSCAGVVLLFAAIGLHLGSVKLINSIYPRDIKIIYDYSLNKENQIEKILR